jgi:hypothetical protein
MFGISNLNSIWFWFYGWLCFLLDFGSLLQISAGWRARSLEEAKYFQIPQLENWLKGKG